MPDITLKQIERSLTVLNSLGWTTLQKTCAEFSRFPDTKRDWNLFKQYCVYTIVKGGYMNNGGYARIAEANGMSPLRARRVVKRLPHQIAALALSGLSLADDFADDTLAQN